MRIRKGSSKILINFLRKNPRKTKIERKATLQNLWKTRFTKLIPDFLVNRVAHAGGGIRGKTYTNSLDALDQNIKNGFVYFEIDFSLTKDDQLVCLHDWKQSFKRSFGFETRGKTTLEGFELLVKNKSEFKKCTLDSLSSWMKENQCLKRCFLVYPLSLYTQSLEHL